MWDTWFLEHEGRAHMFHLQCLAPGSVGSVIGIPAWPCARRIISEIKQEARLSSIIVLLDNRFDPKRGLAMTGRERIKAIKVQGKDRVHWRN